MKFMLGLQHPLTCKPSTTLSNPCNKVRGEYFSKEVFYASLSCVVSSLSSSCVFLRASLLLSRYDTANEYITLLFPSSQPRAQQMMLVSIDIKAGWNEGHLMRQLLLMTNRTITNDVKLLSLREAFSLFLT